MYVPLGASKISKMWYVPPGPPPVQQPSYVSATTYVSPPPPPAPLPPPQPQPVQVVSQPLPIGGSIPLQPFIPPPATTMPVTFVPTPQPKPPVLVPFIPAPATTMPVTVIPEPRPPSVIYQPTGPAQPPSWMEPTTILKTTEPEPAIIQAGFGGMGAIILIGGLVGFMLLGGKKRSGKKRGKRK